MSVTIETLAPPAPYTTVAFWEVWPVTGDMVYIATDHHGRVIDRYRVRVDHDGGDEQP